MNDFAKPLAQWLLAVAIVGFLLAVLCLASAIESAGRVVAAARVFLQRTLFRSGLRPRLSHAPLHAVRLPVSGLEMASEDGEEDRLAAYAELGNVIPFESQVRR